MIPRLKPSARMTRRRAIGLIGLAGAGALLSACAAPTPASPTPAATKPTSAPASPAASPAVASSPAASPAPAASPVAQAGRAAAMSAAEWDQLVAAARQEGQVAVATYAGSAYRRVMEAFEAAYPGIKVELSQFQSSSRDYLPRLIQERRANLFTWDLAFMPNVEMLRQALPAGFLAPIRPLIVQAEILDDRTWNDGFEAGFIDNAGQWSYAFARDKAESVWVDSSVVREGEITGIKDLIDPKWRGKILAGDPRTKGSGYWSGTTMRLKTGNDEVIKQFFKDQETVVGTDARQLTEQMVRGRYPVSVGAVSRQIYEDFRAQGLGQTIKNIEVPEVEYVASGSNLAWYLSQAPHPNAAKVFINWLLSKDALTLYCKELQVNSRRADVPVIEQNTLPRPSVEYLRMDDEKWMDEIEKTQQIARDLLN
jgi:ABC-type Fe3+ transport system substrate-binding protein